MTLGHDAATAPAPGARPGRRCYLLQLAAFLLGSAAAAYMAYVDQCLTGTPDEGCDTATFDTLLKIEYLGMPAACPRCRSSSRRSHCGTASTSMSLALRGPSTRACNAASTGNR
jgi:hypothetical protein